MSSSKTKLLAARIKVALMDEYLCRDCNKVQQLYYSGEHVRCLECGGVCDPYGSTRRRWMRNRGKCKPLADEAFKVIED